MIIKIKLFLISFFCFVVFSFSVKAQEYANEQPLTTVIKTIQEKYGYQFNFAEDSIDGIFIKPPHENLLFQEVLNYLKDETGLLFIIMDDQFVLVKKKETHIFCGYLKNGEDKTPLIGATIQGLNDATTSNENGFFELEINNDLEYVTIRYLGFKTVDLPFKKIKTNTCDELFLYPDYQELSEIILTPYIVNGVNKLKNGTYHIDFSKFEILPGLIDTDVLQSIQAFPGIQSINETVSNINIRGGTHDQNLVLWDGIKMYQSGHFFGLISMYNPQITQKVTLFKNGSNVTQTDGVSGTIAMETEDDVNSKLKGSIGINFIDVNGFVDTPVGERASIQIAARKSISNFVKTPTYSNFFDRISQNTEVESNQNNITNSDESFDFYDTSLRWIYKISDRDELRVNFITVANELQFNENANSEAIQTSRESSLAQNSIAGAVHYDRIWNERWHSSLSIYETDYKLKAINVNLLEAQRFLQENVVSETSAKAFANYKMNKNFNWLNGYHFVETEITNLDDVDTPIFRLKISEVVRTHGVFSQLAYTSNSSNTNLNFGLRFNYIDKFKKQLWEPRLSFTHKFSQNLAIEVLGEFKHQNTSQIINFQNDFLGIEKRRWQLSNDNSIPVIRSKQASVGATYNNKGWLLGAEIYYKYVDGITAQSQGFQNQYEFTRANGYYNTTGFDFLFRKHFKTVNAWLSYSFMNNDYTFKLLSSRSFPSNYEIRHTATLGIAYTTQKLKVSTGLNWHTGKPISKPIQGNEIDGNFVNFGTINGENLKDYLRLDISALYDFDLSNTIKANLGVSIWNLLGRKNEINAFYRIEDEQVIETMQQSLGFTPNAVLRVHF